MNRDKIPLMHYLHTWEKFPLLNCQVFEIIKYWGEKRSEVQEMDDEKLYRINIKFLEPDKLDSAFRARFHTEMENNTIYLGIRFNPTNYNRSAAISTHQLAYQCMSLAKEFLFEDFGEIECHVHEFPCTTDYMKSITEADTRTLINYTRDEGFLSRVDATILENRELIKNTGTG